MTTLPPSRDLNERGAEPRFRNNMDRKNGAGKGARTLGLDLGKVALYQLSYARVNPLRAGSRELAGKVCVF